MFVYGDLGKQYQLDSKPFSNGGEGDIYNIVNSSDKVVKIYHDGHNTKELEQKLQYMAKKPPSTSVMSQVAWPLDVVCDSKNNFCGFVMPKLNITAELSEIYVYPPKTNITYSQKITLAQNICVVISEVHKAGYVFGDFNPRNIGVNTSTGLVAFLDTDSYHIVVDKNTNIAYRCNVCAPGYAAPEILEKCAVHIQANPQDSKQAYAKTPLDTFTRETDNFALAIHLFKLLMNGYTPFGGIKETESASVGSPGVGDSAVRRDSYCFKPGNKPQAAAVPPLEILPQELAELFTRAFMYGKIEPKQRPSAQEWHVALGKYANSLCVCTKNQMHMYDKCLPTCPWCEADDKYQESIAQTITQQSFSAPVMPINIPQASQSAYSSTSSGHSTYIGANQSNGANVGALMQVKQQQMSQMLLAFARKYWKILSIVAAVFLAVNFTLSIVDSYKNAEFRTIDESGNSEVFTRNEIDELIELSDTYYAQQEYEKSLEQLYSIPETYDRYNKVEHKIEESKEQYGYSALETVSELMEFENYKEAIATIMYAQEIVGENQKFMDRLHEVAALYENSIINEVNRYIENKQFQEAVDLLSSATIILENSENFTQKSSEVYSLYKEDMMDQVEQFISNAQYANALKLLNTAVNTFGGDDIYLKINEIKPLYENELLTVAAVEFDSNGYKGAVDILANGMAYLFSSQSVEEALNMYLTYAPKQEAEGNDSSNEANTIYVNATNTGNISESYDHDWYKFTLSEDGVASINFAHEIFDNKDSCWWYGIYNEDVEMIDCWTSPGNKSEVTTENIGIPAGTYYVEVSGCKNDSSDIDYNFDVTFTETAFTETETNDSDFTADTILVNEYYRGSIHRSDDEDWYKFTLGEDGVASINFAHEIFDNKDSCWWYGIYNEDVEMIDCWTSPGNKSEVTTENIGIPAGTYYVKVYGCTDDWSEIDYNFNVTFTETAFTETETNDSDFTADEILVNEYYRGSIHRSDDEDWYKFILNEASVISIDFSHEIFDDKDDWWMFRLYGNDIKMIDYERVYGNKGKAVMGNVELKAGTYFVEVTGSKKYDYNETDYKMRVNN